MNKDQDKYIKSAAVAVWFTSTLEEPKIMLCKRLPSCKRFVGRWGAAGGKVDKGECIIRAAQRELQEELVCMFPRASYAS